ncbi:hypothetical protein [Sorangium sp. So ce117]|uniref:hypothetical protein n=1 Tax=Sorangium sp. So ce117 TaxID=3133277 RepID=UPI003F6352D3
MSIPHDRKRTRHGPFALALLLRGLPVLLLAGCPASPTSNPRGQDRAAISGSKPAAQRGHVPVTVTADRGALRGGTVSLGVPFPPGALLDAAHLRVFDAAGAEVSRRAVSLATWPADGSQRAVLVAWRASLDERASATFTLEYGAQGREERGALAPTPDGPAVARLPPSWYARSRVIGYQLPATENTAFKVWEEKTERYLAEMTPAWQAYGIGCGATALERTYYDAPHALFQRFIHHGTAGAYRRAREESTWYRGNELRWFAGGEVALYACADRWDPATPMAWQHLRNMLGQGMLDDYLLTGDPAALRALRGLGEAYLRNLPALMAGDTPPIRATERNLAWTLMGLTSYYAAEPRPDVREALVALIGTALDWQRASRSGAFEHDIHAPDPGECGDGPHGGSPFMTSLLVDGLMDAWLLLRDPRIPEIVVRAAVWYRDHAINRDGVAFQYLWGCKDVAYQSSAWATLNLLISHVFGAAYLVSGDTSWLDFGDRMARHGIEHLYAGRPKNWTQGTRGFLKYMGYRAEGRAP